MRTDHILKFRVEFSKGTTNQWPLNSLTGKVTTMERLMIVGAQGDFM